MLREHVCSDLKGMEPAYCFLTLNLIFGVFELTTLLLGFVGFRFTGTGVWG